MSFVPKLNGIRFIFPLIQRNLLHSRGLFFFLLLCGCGISFSCGNGMIGGGSSSCKGTDCSAQPGDEEISQPGLSQAVQANNTCDPIEGDNCPAKMQCIAGVCVTPPSTCMSNDDCPLGFLCAGGVCGLNGGGSPQCMVNQDCPDGQVCLSGVCEPESTCQIPHQPNRLQGDWNFDSLLHVRDGLEGITAGLLSVAGEIQKIIDGQFSISGVPSIFTDLVSGMLRDLIHEYVPPWGQQVIAFLAELNDAIDDMRIISVENFLAVDDDQYSVMSTWLSVEFEYKGMTIAAPPLNIPGLGALTIQGYTAREVCGTLYLDKHKVENAVGSIYRWAVEALITGISCSMNDVPCYMSIETMFHDLIDCQALADSVASAVGGTIPGLSGLISAACHAEKQTLIDLIIKELDELTAKITFMSLSAQAGIINDVQLDQGHWSGVLGGAFGNGNFEGSFTAQRQ